MVKPLGALVACTCCLALGAYTSMRGQQSEVKDAKPTAQARAPSASKAATVEMQLAIHDAVSGFALEAKKNVQAGISAFDAMRQVVVVDYKRQPGIGQFITGLCGIEAPRGHFWALYVDDEFSGKGISSIKLDADTKIEWKTQSTEVVADPSPGPSPGPGEGF